MFMSLVYKIGFKINAGYYSLELSESGIECNNVDIKYYIKKHIIYKEN